MTGVKRGEVYYIERGYTEGSEQQAGRPAIIVSNDTCNDNSTVVEVVYLTTQPKHDLPTHVEIRSAVRQSTALCEQIFSVCADRIGDYVSRCTDKEMEQIDIALAISLGLDIAPCEKKESIKPVEVEKIAEKEVVVQDVQTKEALIKAETERDIYKSLCEKMLKKAAMCD